MASISVPGFLDAENRNALDWREGLVAYGCQTLLCVVQVAAQPQLLQTLCGHKLRVALVCFSRREPRGSSLAEGEAVPLMLASADTSGHIILWDVLRGAALTQLTPLLTTSGKPSAVLCMHWLASRPGHLLCAHGSGSVLMWQCSHAGRKVTSLWRSELAEPATHLAFDPLCMTGERMSVYSARGVLRQLALSPSQLPRPAGPSCSVAQQAAATALQLEYSPHQAQQVYLVLLREIVLVDVEIAAVLATVRLDRTDHPFWRISLPVCLPSTILGLHTDGSISSWQRRPLPPTAATATPPCWLSSGNIAPASSLSPPPNTPVNFAFRSISPLLKGSGTSLVAFCAAPPAHHKFAAVSADGRVWLWALLEDPVMVPALPTLAAGDHALALPPAFTPDYAEGSGMPLATVAAVEARPQPKVANAQALSNRSGASSVSSPSAAQQPWGVKLVGIVGAIGSPIRCIAVQPPLPPAGPPQFTSGTDKPAHAPETRASSATTLVNDPGNRSCQPAAMQESSIATATAQPPIGSHAPLGSHSPALESSPALFSPVSFTPPPAALPLGTASAAHLQPPADDPALTCATSSGSSPPPSSLSSSPPPPPPPPTREPSVRPQQPPPPTPQTSSGSSDEMRVRGPVPPQSPLSQVLVSTSSSMATAFKAASAAAASVAASAATAASVAANAATQQGRASSSARCDSPAAEDPGAPPVHMPSTLPPPKAASSAPFRATVEETLVAVGTENGRVLLVRPSTRVITLEVQIFDETPIVSMDWLSRSLLCVGGYMASTNSTSGGAGDVSSSRSFVNTVKLLDVTCCAVRDLIPARGPESSALSAVKMSQSGRRLLLAYRGGGFRLVDLRTGRDIAGNVLPTLPAAAALEWLPSPSSNMSSSGGKPPPPDSRAEEAFTSANGADGSSRRPANELQSTAAPPTRTAAGTPSAQPGPATSTAGGGPPASATVSIDDDRLLLALADGGSMLLKFVASRIFASRSASTSAPELVAGQVCALAASGPWIASASTEGAVYLWHSLAPSARRQIASLRGAVRALAFDGPSPASIAAKAQLTSAVCGDMSIGAENHTAWPTQLLALLADGELVLWSLPLGPPWALPPAASSGRPTPTGRPTAIAFSASGQPITAIEGGCLVLLRRDLVRVNMPIDARRTFQKPKCTALLPRRAHAQLLTQLMHSPPPSSRDAKSSCTGAYVHPRVAEWLPRDSLRRLSRPMPLPQRCAAISLELGLPHDWVFWCIVSARLAEEKGEHASAATRVSAFAADIAAAGGVANGLASQPLDPLAETTRSLGTANGGVSSVPEANDGLQRSDGDTVGEGVDDLWPNFGLLRKASAVRADRLSRLAEQGSVQHSSLSDHAAAMALAPLRRAAHESLIAGAPSIAAHLLLGGDLADETDWLLGVIAASAVSGEARAEAAARGATKLLERGRVPQAVALLCACGLGPVAVAELQARGEWETAATLAKSSLSPEERRPVLARWAEHLRADGQGGRAIEILISLGSFEVAVERLLEMSDYQPAALLMRAMRERKGPVGPSGDGVTMAPSSRPAQADSTAFEGVAESQAHRSTAKSVETTGSGGPARETSTSPSPSTETSCQADLTLTHGGVAQRAFLEYSAYLSRLGLPSLAREYIGLAAEEGTGTAAAISMAEAEQMHQQYVTVQRQLEGVEEAP